MSARELAEVFFACTSADNAKRKAGEEALRQLSRTPIYLSDLLQCAQASTELQVRQLALTQLRKYIIANPTLLDQQVRRKIKAALQDIISRANENSVVRRLGGQALAAVAKSALPANEWPDFFPWLENASNSPDPMHRELALMVFTSLMSYLGAEMRQYFMALAQICGAGLSDSSPEVQRVALQAVSSLGEWAADDVHVKAIHKLLPPLFKLIQSANNADDEETTIEGFTTVTDLLENPMPFFTAQMPQLVEWCMQVVVDKNKPLIVRQSALQVIETIGANKPKQFVKTGLVKHCVAALCTMCAEPDPVDYEEDSDDLPSNKVASQALDALAQALPSSQVFPTALEYARQHITSADGEKRRSACDAIVVMAEGCSKLVRKHLETVLKIVLAGVRDSLAKSRGAAVFAIGQLAEHCQPEIAQQARHILPAVFALVNDADQEVQEQAHYALQTFCDSLEEDVVEYLGDLVSALGQVLQHGKVEAKKSALRAMASAASAAEKAFEPYVNDLLPVLQHYMTTTQGDLLSCRGPATEVVGVLCQAVGAGPLHHSLPSFMEAAFQGFQMDDTELKEYTHLMLSNVAAALGEAFSVYLKLAIERAVQSLSTDSTGGTGTSDKDDDKSVSLNSMEESDAEEAENSHDTRLNTHTALLEEQSAALHALGSYAENAPHGFAPYIEKILPLVLQLCEYYHDTVREEAFTVLGDILHSAREHFPTGSPGQCSHQVQSVAAEAVPVLILAINDEDSKEGVAAAITTLSKYVSSGADIAGSCQEASALVTKILLGHALCQATNSEGEEWEDEAEDDKEENGDELLIAAAAELVVALSKTYSQAYSSIWRQEHYSIALEHLRPSKPSGVRVAAMGMIADVLKALGANLPDLPKLLASIKREMRQDEPENQRVALFCLGIVAQHQPKLFQDHVKLWLQAIYPFLQADVVGNVKDNALGAVAKLTATCSDQASFPVEEVVATMIEALPLQEDFEEALPVYMTLCALLNSPTICASHVRPLLEKTLDNALLQEEIPDSLKVGIRHHLQIQAFSGVR